MSHGTVPCQWVIDTFKYTIEVQALIHSETSCCLGGFCVSAGFCMRAWVELPGTYDQVSSE